MRDLSAIFPPGSVVGGLSPFPPHRGESPKSLPPAVGCPVPASRDAWEGVSKGTGCRGATPVNGCGTLCVPSCSGESHQVPGAGFFAKRNGKQGMGAPGIPGSSAYPQKRWGERSRSDPCAQRAPRGGWGGRRKRLGLGGWKPQTQRTRGCGGLGLRGLREGVTHNLL